MFEYAKILSNAYRVASAVGRIKVLLPSAYGSKLVTFTIFILICDRISHLGKPNLNLFYINSFIPSATFF